MTPGMMSALGQHAAKTSGVAGAQESADAATAAYQAAERQKQAAELALRNAREQAERQARQGQAYDAALRLFTMNLSQLPLMVLGNLMHGRGLLAGLTPGGGGAAEKKGEGDSGGEKGKAKGDGEKAGERGKAKAAAGAATAAATAKGGGGSGGGGMAGGIAGAVVGLVVSFVKLLGDGIKTLMSAPTSGAQTFNKAVGLLVASVAPVLMPAMFLLAVAVASTSDVLFSELLPVVGDLASILMQAVVPALVQFAQVLAWAARTAREVGQWGTRATNTLAHGGKDRRDGQQGGVVGWMSRNVFDPATAPLRSWQSGKDQERGKKSVGDAMRDTMGELKLLTMNTPVASGGSASAYTRAQTAVLSQSPFERRMQDLLSQVVTMMGRKSNESQGGGGQFADAASGTR